MFRAANFAQAKPLMSSILCPYQEKSSTNAGLVEVRHAPFDGIRVVSLRQRHAAIVEVEQARPYALVAALVGGSARCSPSAAPQRDVRPGNALFIEGRLPYRMEFSDNCKLLMFRLDHPDGSAGSLPGRKRPRDFSSISFDTSAGLELLRLCDFLLHEASLGSGLTAPGDSQRYLAGAVESALLQAFDMGARPGRGAGRGTPAWFRLVLEQISENPDEIEDFAQLSERYGTSYRTMCRLFQAKLGMTPTDYLRTVRLERAHADLVSADAGAAKVIDIAFRWRFFHLGKFASLYRRRFGCLPSDTLRGA